jgi:hypothetical protein
MKRNTGYYLPTYSSGWSTTSSEEQAGQGKLGIVSYTPGWFLPGKYMSDVANRLDSFFVAQHTIPKQPDQNASGGAFTYQRSTQRTSCVLHRGKYNLTTEYLNGERKLSVSASVDDTLEALWNLNQHPNPGRRAKYESCIPMNGTSSYQVMNIFALFESLVQALGGKYYNGTAIFTINGTPERWRLGMLDSVHGFLRKLHEHCTFVTLTDK